MRRNDLLARKEEIQAELSEINRKLATLDKLDKPFEACVHGYSSPGISSTSWKTEEQARKKYDEYLGKTYFRNGLIYGVILYRNNEDGTRTVLAYDWRMNYGMPKDIKALEERE